jgi:16S rRNA (adenine1518-N6/adenine1519-N6)-dimethyltransferase
MSAPLAPPGPSSARALLARYGLRPKKSWGQNFLEDENIRIRIVAAAGLGAEDVVVEIGAGLGAITARLLPTARRVIAVERDRDMVRVLTGELGADPRLVIREEDALSFDLAAAAREAGRPLVVVGNLPYQITSPLLFKIAEESAGGEVVGRAVLMVQREFAERMVAPPGGKIYGRLSVMIQQLARVRRLFDVGSHAFLPRPAVTSTVFSLEPRPAPLAPVKDAALFAAAVRVGFGARRKTLRRALATAFGDAPAQAALEAAGIDGARRAETLAVEEFGRLADGLLAAGVSAERAASSASELGEEGDA